MTDTHDDSGRPEAAEAAARPRRREYRTPELKEYGPVAKLTQSGPGSDMEGSTPLRAKVSGRCL